MEIEKIYFAVKDIYKVDYKSSIRKTKYREARMMFSKIAFDYKYSHEEIALYLNRDRTGVYNTLKRFSEYIEVESNFREKYQMCIDDLFGIDQLKISNLTDRYNFLIEEIYKVTLQMKELKNINPKACY